jgi:hypothetical protein
MAIFDAVEQKPPSKTQRYVITGVALVVIFSGVLWWMLRFHTEKVTIHHFMNAVIAGDMQEAYRIWKPSPSFSLRDFTDDWGTNGYYGPVKSFHMERPYRPRGGSAVAIKLELSPYQPFPDDNDMVKQSKTKEVTLWVQFNDQSISYPPD